MHFQQLTTVTTYDQSRCAAFMRSRERFGDLSNMTYGFPIKVNDVTFQSSEGLYQALKFPHDPIRQKDIARARSGMDAKKVAYLKDRRPVDNWDDIRVDAMAATLALKLVQHPVRFGAALMSTSGLHIVEKSYRDPFWGARPQGRRLVGANVLGKLLQELADRYIPREDPLQAAHRLLDMADASNLIIAGEPLLLPD